MPQMVTGGTTQRTPAEPSLTTTVYWETLMAYPDIATKADLANELTQMGNAALEHEDLLTYVRSLLVAIYNGGMLDELPQEEHARDRHNAAMHLLSDLLIRLQRHEELTPDDLSNSLWALAKDVKEGTFSYRFVPEDISDMPSLTAKN
jgi:hypothetical protein